MGKDSTKLLDGIADTELLAQITQKDAEAFTRFYTRTADVLYSTALSILRDPELAEDVLQEVYTQVWRNAEAFDPALGKPIAWVIALTRNKALDRLRSSKRRNIAMEKLAALEAATDSLLQVDRSDEMSDTVVIVKKILRAFPEKQRRSLELALFEGLTHAEVSKVLKEPLGTVKAWIRRGIIELRDRLGRDL